MRQQVVIVGGGIVGLSVAYELARRGVEVTVLERDTVGGGQSSRNWGFVRQQGRSTQELPMMRAANERWQELEAETGEEFGWVKGGNLAFATDHEGAARYRAWMDVGRGHGLDTRLVDAAEVERLAPGLRLPHTAALYTSSDGHVDPARATHAIGRAAARHGAEIVQGVAVRSIAHDRGRVVGVDTDRGRYPASTVVCAAGTFSGDLLRRAGVRLPQNVVRGTVAMTEPADPLLSTTVWAPGLAFRQRRDGRFVVSTGGGGEVDLTVGLLRHALTFLPAFRHNHKRLRLRLNGVLLRDLRDRVTGTHRTVEPRPTRARAHASLRRFREVLPALADIRLERAWAGYIDATPDALPVLDRLDEPTGLVIATGFSGHGFGLAPAAALAVADLATDATPSLDLDPFRLARFAEGDFRAPDAIL